MSDQRFEQAQLWLNTFPELGALNITPLAGDASFRRYFRVISQLEAGQSYVLMDAPPEKEDVGPFLQVRRWLESNGLRVPQLIRQDEQQGFLLLEDFGDQTWAVCLTQQYDSTVLFEDALQQLHQLQAAQAQIALPIFDMQRMRTECDLYLDWYLPYVQQYQPSTAEREAFHQDLAPLLERIAALPQTPVHLDYHSRNLMLPKQGVPLGIIDFQDAVIGPITYDLASLLYDCYQDYPESARLQWSKAFFAGLSQTHQAHFMSDVQQWHKALRQTALQRHIKAIGIFARLAHRDAKHQFLKEIPLTCQHLMDELQVLNLDIPLLNIHAKGMTTG
ncbi:MAG: phosphotransferase [Mariprofundaceae bacterium]|nr:phosphotransferase [Mariprofundaceae bacterium]